MANSLQDQLLKSGLVSKQKAKKHNQRAKAKTHDKQKLERKYNKRGKELPTDKDSVAYLAEQKQIEVIEKTKELNRQKEVQRLEKELQAQVRDLIQRHQVNNPKANIRHNFVIDSFVKEIFVNSSQQKELTYGHLAIVVSDNNYFLVPAPIAEKLLERVPETVVSLEKNKQQEDDKDDPYADYPIPDDLMW
ncbi:MAG: DUF2058 domain-containing protein [Thiomargarita sp.]|nr:DUF2058 domain-containing protein [Thiomargarita sp.]